MKYMIEFQTYHPAFQSACEDVFRSNIPEYFAEKEIPGFVDSLNHPNDLFEVMLLDWHVIGLGGIWTSEERKEARLCYGIIHQNYQKRGYGRLLLERRLEKINSYGFVTKITHETGEGTYKFFERYGFETVRIDKDPENIGIDFYQMEKKIEQGSGGNGYRRARL